MSQNKFRTLLMVSLATLLSVPALAINAGQPGTINYVEGQAMIGTQTIQTNSVGSLQLMAGQSLTTEKGKAELLLTPGVFLRVADNSSVTMVSPDLANTQVRVEKGRAMVEVDEIHKENRLLIDEDGVTTRLMKKGLYDFDADRSQVRVFDGEALANIDLKEIKLKGGRQLNLNGQLKAQKFDKDQYQDTFYRWASLRSDYLAEANADAARSYRSSGNLWVGSGWYWDPWFGAYTFVPATGYLYNPFGWAYYSPAWSYSFPYRGYGLHRFGRGFTHVYPHRGFVGRANRGAAHGAFGRAGRRR